MSGDGAQIGPEAELQLEAEPGLLPETEPEAGSDSDPDFDMVASPAGPVTPAAPATAAERRKRWVGLGCAGALVLVLGLIGYSALSWLRSAAAPPQPYGQGQLQGLELSGTWVNVDGASLVFGAADSVEVSGFTMGVRYKTAYPPESGMGSWVPGRIGGSPWGVEIMFPNGSAYLLLVEGDASAPTFVCDTGADDPVCTFSKQL